jgi:hypothetical protein
VPICEGQDVTTAEIRSAFDCEGFVILPVFLEPDEIRDAVADLSSEFPTADEFHSDADPQRNARFRDEFGGITPFPAESTALNLLSVQPRLIDLAAVLGADDLRSYPIEFWAKYTGQPTTTSRSTATTSTTPSSSPRPRPRRARWRCSSTSPT